MGKLFGSLKSCLGLGGKKESASVASDNTATTEEPDFFNNETATLEELPGLSLFFEECGHTGSQKFRFNIWGRVCELELKDCNITKKKGVKTTSGICPRCYFDKAKAAAIRCWLCGCAILPGDGVALYYKRSPDINLKVATFVGDSAIGCLSMDCCATGALFGGHWTFEGFKSAFDKEGETVAGKAFSSGQPVFKNI